MAMSSKSLNNKRLQGLQKGSKKLHKEVEELEDALILHQRFQEIEDTSVRGMIRKEIGGSIWQHGAAGKLRTYKSTRDLDDTSTQEIGNIRAKIRKKDIKSKLHSIETDTNLMKTKSPGQDIQSRQRSDHEISNKPSKLSVKVNMRHPLDDVTSGHDGDNPKALNLMSTGDEDPKYQQSGLLSDQMIGNYDVNKVEFLKTKVLERASANVIQRRRVSGKQKEEDVDKEKQKKNSSDVVIEGMGKHHIARTHSLRNKDNRRVKYTKENNTGNSSKNLLGRDNPVVEGYQENVPVQSEKTFSDLDMEYSSSQHSSRTPNTSFPKQTNRMLSVDLELLAKSVALNGSEAFGNHGLFGSSPRSSLQESNILRQSSESHRAQSSPKCDPNVLLWLRSLGLLEEEKYVHIFAENEIDMEELVRLNEQHLKNIGVVAVGASNKILRGIQELQQRQVGKASSAENMQITTSQEKKMPLGSSGSIHKALNFYPADKSTETPEIPVVSNTPQKNSLLEKVPTENLFIQNENDSNNLKREKFQSSDNNTAANRPKSSLAGKSSKRDHSVDRCKSANENKSHQKKPQTTSKQKDKVTSLLLSGVKPGAKSTSAKHRKGKNRDAMDNSKGDNYVNSQFEGRKHDATHKMANTGVDDAAKKIEERQKQETENQKKRNKMKERQKHHRDELARKHEEREKHREELARRHWELEKIRQMEIPAEDIWSNPELTMEDLTTDGTHASRKEKEPRMSVSSQKSRSKPLALRHSVLVPASALELRSEEIGKNVMLASYLISSRPPKPRSDSPRKSRSASKAMESQIESLQTRALSGDLVTVQLVKDLQLRLDQLENQITVEDSQIRHRSRTKKEVLSTGSGLSSGFTTEDVMKMKTDLKNHSKQSGTGTSTSMSKRELLNEIRKEKNEHKKQLRHLHSELSKVNEDQNTKGNEVNTRDISFKETDLIGEGTFSRVYKGTYQNQDVAIKQLKTLLSAQDKNYFSAEVSLLRDLKHPRVVLMMGVCTSDGLPLMILEYMARGSLYHHLHNNREELDHVEYFRIAHDIALGMSYLHHQKPAVLHLDLKSMNVLLCSNYRAKIADFGFSKLRHDADVKARKTSKSKPLQGSPAWMAPELLETGEITPKADVYSFGVILWEMLTRKQPYEGCSVFQVLERVRLNKRPQLPDNCPNDLVDFVQDCWHTNPARRPSFKEILLKLDSLAFPTEWRNLFEKAGVPDEVLEDVQSARTIISLVNNTLDTENVKTLVKDIQQSIEEKEPIIANLSQEDHPVRKSVINRSMKSSVSQPMGSLLSDRSHRRERHSVRESVTSRSLDERHRGHSSQSSPLLSSALDGEVLLLPSRNKESARGSRQNIQEKENPVNRKNLSEDKQSRNVTNNGNNRSSQQCDEGMVQGLMDEQVENGQDSLNSTLETESLPSMDSDSLELSHSNDSLEDGDFENSLKLATNLNSGRKVLVSSNTITGSERSGKSYDENNEKFASEHCGSRNEDNLLELCQSLDKNSARVRFERSAGSSDHLLSELSTKLKGIDLTRTTEDLTQDEKLASSMVSKSLTRTAWKSSEETKKNEIPSSVKTDLNTVDETKRKHSQIKSDLNNSCQSTKFSVKQTLTGKDKTNVVEESINHDSSKHLPVPSMIPPPPPPPPLPGTIPRQNAKPIIVTPMGVSKDQCKTRERSIVVKVPNDSDEKVMFLVKSSDLREQREQLLSTAKPHPNQLQDLSNVNKVTITSIAEILKKAVSNRRTAIDDGAGSPPLSVASSWSFMDE